MNIVFLSYLNRSGSTYLASRLNEYNDILVGLETKIKDGIYKGKKIYLRNEIELNDYLKDIESDKKYAAWGVDLKKLKSRILKNQNYPITFRDILLNSFLELKVNNESIFIHKNGHYLFHYYRTKKVFPKAKFIYVRRDPRAIFSSQKRSIDSTKHNVMQDDVVKFALSIKYSYSKVNKLINNRDVYLINYETLLLDEDQEINKILTFIGSNGELSIKTGDEYSIRIPDDQKHLHNKILNEPDINRIDAWKSELSTDEILFINSVLHKELNASGYITDTRRTCKSTKVILMYLKFYLYRISGIYKAYILMNRYL